jgi:hypothetical protein
MHNIFLPLSYLCTTENNSFNTAMKKTTAFSSLLLLGGLGSLSYLAAQVLDLNLDFDLAGEESCHYC